MWERSSVVTLFFVKKSLTQNDRCAGALSLRRHQLLPLSPICGGVPSDRIRKATKDVSVHSLVTVAIGITYTSEFL